MRRLLSCAAIFLFAACAFAATPPLSNKYTKLVNQWFAPNSTYADCTTTIKTTCLNTYTYTATDPTGAANIVTVPNGGVPAGGAVLYTFTPGSFLLCGSWTVSAVTNYMDDAGVAQSSSADTTTVSVPCPLVASPATGITATLAP